MKYKKRKVKRELNARLISLTRNHYAIVDSKDFLWLSQWNWYLNIVGQNYYAVRNTRRNGELKLISMHEAILGKPPKGKETDHIDCYGLNNMRSNLRFCTHRENLQNQRPKARAFSSKYKGVSKSYYRIKTQTQMWKAYIHKEKRYDLGVFVSEVEAAKAYDIKALLLFGEFARINFPQK